VSTNTNYTILFSLLRIIVGVFTLFVALYLFKPLGGTDSLQDYEVQKEGGLSHRKVVNSRIIEKPTQM
jgi:hypothetical protein